MGGIFLPPVSFSDHFLKNGSGSESPLFSFFLALAFDLVEVLFDDGPPEIDVVHYEVVAVSKYMLG